MTAREIRVGDFQSRTGLSDETLLSSELELKKESVKFGIIHLLQYHDPSESDNLRYSSFLIGRHVR